MHTITEIRIPRCEYVLGDRVHAVIHLNNIEHSVGKPVMVRYGLASGGTDTITAIGIKMGKGPDCYSIVSEGGVNYVAEVNEDLPDVSSLIHNITYIAKFNDTWCSVYIDGTGTTRVIGALSDGSKFYCLSDGHDYYYKNGEVVRDDDLVGFINDTIEVLRRGEIKLEVSSNIRTKYKPGEIIPIPSLTVLVKDKDGNDMTTLCEFSIKSGGRDIPFSILRDQILIDTNIQETTEYSVTASYSVGYEEPVKITTTIKYWVIRPCEYGPEQGEMREILWAADENLDILTSLNRDRLILKVPAEFPRFTHIYDAHGLDYIDDYTILSTPDWTIYTKEDAVSIDNFRQIFTL